MASGKYHIQFRYDFDPSGRWKTDLRLQGMGKDFARGAFFVLRGLGLDSREYRLIKCDIPPHPKTSQESIEVIETHRTGKICVNSKKRED